MFSGKFQQKEFISHANHMPHRLSYLEWGDENNQEILICVHGLARNSRDFDFVANELSHKYRIISIDVVGRGKSQWVDSSLYNYESYVKDISSLYDHLEIDQAHWLGTSMGGLIGMMFSAARPGSIKKMCLNDIGPFIPKESLIRIAKYVGLNPKFDDMVHAESHMRMILAKFGIKTPVNWRYITANSIFYDENGNLRLAYDPKISEIFSKNSENVADVDLKELWSKVNFEECLVLRGEVSDILLPETLEYMLSTKQNITSISFPSIGHAPALMEHDQLDKVVNWFLK